MASSFFRRLADRFGNVELRGQKYQALIKKILAHNKEKAGNAVGRLTAKNFKDSLKRISKEKAKTIKLPDVSKVLPKRSVFMIKGAQSGKMVSNTLRSALERDLRGALKEFDGTGKKRMEIQRGRTTGKINPELIELFKSKISETFDGYTKRDKKTGIPPNIRDIAVTEVRSTIGLIKDAYVDKLLKNPNLEIEKTWLHNRQLSKEPRKPHMALHKTTIPYNDRFKVGRKDNKGFDYMRRPHDPESPRAQVIGCSCDYIVRARIK